MNDLVRDEKGRFVKGQSGNPAGKTKGLKNYITHERLMLEAALRDYVGDPKQADKLVQGIDRVLQIAISGEDAQAISAMKLLLDRVMPAMPPKVEEEASKLDKRLHIVIQTNPEATTPIEIIEGQFSEIEED
jgi:hypothetical protein